MKSVRNIAKDQLPKRLSSFILRRPVKNVPKLFLACLCDNRVSPPNPRLRTSGCKAMLIVCLFSTIFFITLLNTSVCWAAPLSQTAPCVTLLKRKKERFLFSHPKHVWTLKQNVTSTCLEWLFTLFFARHHHHHHHHFNLTCLV